MTQTADHAYRTAFAIWFSIGRAQARLLTELYLAAGEPMQSNGLATRAQIAAGALGFHLTQLRKTLESEAIDHLPGRGYCLTDIGLAECRGALWQMGEELRRAS